MQKLIICPKTPGQIYLSKSSKGAFLFLNFNGYFLLCKVENYSLLILSEMWLLPVIEASDFISKVVEFRLPTKNMC